MNGNGGRDDRQHSWRDRRHPWAKAALRYGTIGLAIVLFFQLIRCSDERVGRMAERIETMEKVNEVQRRLLEAAARRPRDRDELFDRLRDGGF